MRASLILGSIALVCASVVNAQTAAPPPPAVDDTPSVKVGVVLFTDYTYQSSLRTLDSDGNAVHASSFNISRAYVNVTGKLNHWILFRVTPDVLIPRPETERLVEITLGVAREFPENKALKILDVGTGSGAIAVSLARELPSSMIWATDVSIEALEIARSNAARYSASERVRLLHGDLFEPIGEIAGRFDLIVSNPPYIRSAEIVALEPEVSLWEPRGALDGGVDGLDFYRRIAREASDHLAPNGTVAVEIGADMGKEVARLFAGGGCYTGVTVFQDYAGRDRVVMAKLAGKKAKSIF